MNSYEIGFINKCAEYGINPYDLSGYVADSFEKDAGYDDISSYEIGFIEKCAEYGVDPYELSDYIDGLYKDASKGHHISKGFKKFRQHGKAMQRAWHHPTDPHIPAELSKKLVEAKRAVGSLGDLGTVIKRPDKPRATDTLKQVTNMARGVQSAVSKGTDPNVFKNLNESHLREINNLISKNKSHEAFLKDQFNAQKRELTDMFNKKIGWLTGSFNDEISGLNSQIDKKKNVIGRLIDDVVNKSGKIQNLENRTRITSKNRVSRKNMYRNLLNKAMKRGVGVGLGAGTLVGGTGAGIAGYNLGKRNAPEPPAPQSFGEKLKYLLSNN